MQKSIKYVSEKLVSPFRPTPRHNRHFGRLVGLTTESRNSKHAAAYCFATTGLLLGLTAYCDEQEPGNIKTMSHIIRYHSLEAFRRRHWIFGRFVCPGVVPSHVDPLHDGGVRRRRWPMKWPLESRFSYVLMTATSPKLVGWLVENR